jgi:hypothetical protein
MLQALSDRHLAVTGVALTPRLVVTDFEVRSHRKKTFETEFFFFAKTSRLKGKRNQRDRKISPEKCLP